MTTKDDQTKPQSSATKPHDDLARAKIICVVGGPGVGKGTHCGKLAEDFGLVHVSVGDLLRHEVAKQNAPHKAIIEERMRGGSLVPNQIVQEILENCLFYHVRKGNHYFLVDGFPRSVQQALDFKERDCNLRAVLHFHSSEDTMRTRMLKRAATAGENHRMDDTLAIFEKRVADFAKESQPVIDFYKGEHLYEMVDCEREFNEVYPYLQDLVKSILTKADDSVPL